MLASVLMWLGAIVLILDVFTALVFSITWETWKSWAAVVIIACLGCSFLITGAAIYDNNPEVNANLVEEG